MATLVCAISNTLAFNSGDHSASGKPRKKTAERRSVVAGQNLTVEPATVCVRQSSFDNRANRGEPQHVLDVPLLASPSVRGRRDQRQPVRTSPATSPMYRSAKVRTLSPPKADPTKM